MILLDAIRHGENHLQKKGTHPPALYSVLLFLMLGTEPRASHRLRMPSSTEPHPQPSSQYLKSLKLVEDKRRFCWQDPYGKFITGSHELWPKVKRNQTCTDGSI